MLTKRAAKSLDGVEVITRTYLTEYYGKYVMYKHHNASSLTSDDRANAHYDNVVVYYINYVSVRTASRIRLQPLGVFSWK